MTDLHFAKSHLLLADNVPGGSPILATRDVVFTHIMVEAKTEQNLVIAVDGRTSEMWKLSHWKEGSEWKWSLLEHRKLYTGGHISAVALLPGGTFNLKRTNYILKLRILFYIIHIGSSPVLHLSLCPLPVLFPLCS